jgi:hypothetical protein
MSDLPEPRGNPVMIPISLWLKILLVTSSPVPPQRYFDTLENKPVFSMKDFYEVCRRFCTSKAYSVKTARIPLCGYQGLCA